MRRSENAGRSGRAVGRAAGASHALAAASAFISVGSFILIFNAPRPLSIVAAALAWALAFAALALSSEVENALPIICVLVNFVTAGISCFVTYPFFGAAVLYLELLLPGIISVVILEIKRRFWNR